MFWTGPPRLLPQVCREYGEDQERRQVPVDAEPRTGSPPQAQAKPAASGGRRAMAPAIANTQKAHGVAGGASRSSLDRRSRGSRIPRPIKQCSTGSSNGRWRLQSEGPHPERATWLPST